MEMTGGEAVAAAPEPFGTPEVAGLEFITLAKPLS